jgi:dihydrofolate reductase
VTVALVAAIARGGVIGRSGGIPWHIPEDVAHFKALTTGHSVVMGRKTWESLPERFRPLPDRRNVVVTRNSAWSASGAERAESVEAALEALRDVERVFVIGGAEIYAAALPFADELVLTEVDLDVDGDTFFPEWDRNAFVEISREERAAEDGTRFAFVHCRSRATVDALADGQLAALTAVDALLGDAGIAYWLFGGWAVDFHAGSITRQHDDIDIAVWLEDVPRIAELLTDAGWIHAPDVDEDGGTGFERADVRLELTYLVRRDDGSIVTPLRNFEAPWPEGAFAGEARSLGTVSAQVISLTALARGKSSPREDPSDAAKDMADRAVLTDL